uniref:Uncharacterized protein LOC107412612 n=1 Tax=Rhizophora mucronata TaxID=61149 RepID=A0A2P2KBY0_RHIMU
MTTYICFYSIFVSMNIECLFWKSHNYAAQSIKTLLVKSLKDYNEALAGTISAQDAWYKKKQ